MISLGCCCAFGLVLASSLSHFELSLACVRLVRVALVVTLASFLDLHCRQAVVHVRRVAGGGGGVCGGATADLLLPVAWGRSVWTGWPCAAWLVFVDLLCVCFLQASAHSSTLQRAGIASLTSKFCTSFIHRLSSFQPHRSHDDRVPQSALPAVGAAQFLCARM